MKIKKLNLEIDWKGFLKPDKKKVLLSIVLFPIILVIITVLLKNPFTFRILLGVYLLELLKWHSYDFLNNVNVILLDSLSLLSFIFFIYLISCLFFFSLRFQRIRKYSIGILLFIVISSLSLVLTNPIACYLSNFNERAGCFYDKVTKNALKKLDETECKKIPRGVEIHIYTSETARDRCLREIFLAKKILPKNCNDFDLKDSCEDIHYQLLSEWSIQQNNVSLCNLALGKRDECYLHFAISKDNPKICELIDSNATECWGGFRGGGGCKYIKNDCYLHFAIKRLNVDFCNKIEHKEKIGPTRSECIREVVEKSKNASLAQSVNITLCDTFPSYLQDSCFSDVAYITKNPDICEGIKDMDERDNCFFSLAKKLKDGMICYRILPLSCRPRNCLNKIFGYDTPKPPDPNYYNVSICDIVNFTTEQRDRCYMHFALKTNNPSICEKINDTHSDRIEGDRNYCYRTIAYELKNKTICYKLPSEEEIKKECLDACNKKRKAKDCSKYCDKVSKENSVKGCLDYISMKESSTTASQKPSK